MAPSHCKPHFFKRPHLAWLENFLNQHKNAMHSTDIEPAFDRNLNLSCSSPALLLDASHSYGRLTLAPLACVHDYLHHYRWNARNHHNDTTTHSGGTCTGTCVPYLITSTHRVLDYNDHRSLCIKMFVKASHRWQTHCSKYSHCLLPDSRLVSQSGNAPLRW